MTHGLGRLTPTTLGSDCYQLLKAAILDLDLPPGTVLVEQQLASQLGISKTPVREALARLAGEGLVVSSSNGRQTIVGGMSLESIRELYEIRILIECAHLRETGHDLTSSELRQLEEYIVRSAEAVELDGFGGLLDANDAFHLFLIRRSGNKTLVSHMAGIFQQLSRVRAALRKSAVQTSALPAFSSEGLKAHQRIHEALAVHDAESAAFHMRGDITWFMELLQNHTLQSAIERLSLENR